MIFNLDAIAAMNIEQRFVVISTLIKITKPLIHSWPMLFDAYLVIGSFCNIGGKVAAIDCPNPDLCCMFPADAFDSLKFIRFFERLG